MNKNTQELQIKNGFYYGLNQQTKDIITYNHHIDHKPNGLVLGKPGVGMSFTSKMNITKGVFYGKER